MVKRAHLLDWGGRLSRRLSRSRAPLQRLSSWLSSALSPASLRYPIPVDCQGMCWVGQLWPFQKRPILKKIAGTEYELSRLSFFLLCRLPPEPNRRLPGGGKRRKSAAFPTFQPPIHMLTGSTPTGHARTAVSHTDTIAVLRTPCAPTNSPHHHHPHCITPLTHTLPSFSAPFTFPVPGSGSPREHR